jgi:hypothetical protein
VKTGGGMLRLSPPFLTSAQEDGEWSTSCLQERTHLSHLSLTYGEWSTSCPQERTHLSHLSLT